MSVLTQIELSPITLEPIISQPSTQETPKRKVTKRNGKKLSQSTENKIEPIESETQSSNENKNVFIK